MKKTFLLKTMLLLCALVVGGSAWAGNATFVPDDFTNQGTSGSGSNITATVSGVTFACSKGYGTTQIRCYSGGKITISSSNIITGINFTFAGDYTGGLNESYTNLSTNSHEFTLGSQARFTEISVTYCTITPASNNNSWGTAELSGNVITATPAEGYRVSTSNPYTVTAGTATVAQNGNSFTVTATSDCTVTINFERIPTYTASFSINGVINSNNNVDLEEGAAITFPSNLSAIGGKTFVGWVAAPINGTTNTAPTFITSATMGTSDITYYAVYAMVTGNTPESWTETALSDITSSDVFVFSTGSYAMNNDGGTSDAPSANAITVDSNGKITSTVTDNLKWKFSGSATDGYTFYPNGSSTTWLYCNTTSSSSNNNNIRVGTGNRKLWEFDTNGYLKTKDSNTTRYLSLYNSQDFRGYTGTGNGAFVPKFYKYTAASLVATGYCTTIAQTVEISSAGLATFAYDYALDYSGVTGLEAYIAKEVTQGENTTIITLQKVNKVPAETGVLLRATAGETSFNVPVTTATTDNVTGNKFVRGEGTAVATGTGPYNYILNIVNNQIGFYKANGQTVATNRAYLQTSVAAGARIAIDLDPSGINFINCETTTDNRYYDLQGRPVAQPTKGLYIVNGKKVIIK